MSDKRRPDKKTKSDRNDEVAPKRVGFMFDPRESSIEDMVAAIHRAWEGSNQSPGGER